MIVYFVLFVCLFKMLPPLILYHDFILFLLFLFLFYCFIIIITIFLIMILLP